jgi:hypothetical protein
LGLLIEYVNDKSPGSQEEIDYLLCWRQGLVTLFPLKLGKKDRGKQKEKSPKWDSLSCLPPPSNPEASQATPQDQEKDPNQELHKP